MVFFVKRKNTPAATPPADTPDDTPADVPLKPEISNTIGNSGIGSTDTPPPQYSAADSSSQKFAPTETTTDSRSSTLDISAVSTVYSPDLIKGATRQPTVSGGNVIVARHQAPPVEDGSLPEVVIHNTGDTIATQSHASDSHLSLHTPSLSMQGDSTVTPLHLLGDQSDMVDCPFCRRRVETRVQKDPSAATHASAAGLFLVSIGGVVVPYKRQWKHHITHFCTNCSRRVAYQRNGQNAMQPLGTPEHLREASKFLPAVPQRDPSSTTLS